MEQTKQQVETENQLHSIKDACSRSSLCDRTWRRAIAEGKVKVVRLGSRVMIPRRELDRILAKGF